MKAPSNRLSSSFWKASKLSLASGKRLYRAAFGLKTLSNVNDKAALAKKASNPAVLVNWEAVTNPEKKLEDTFTAQERDFYGVLRDLVAKGEVNPSEWIGGDANRNPAQAPNGTAKVNPVVEAVLAAPTVDAANGVGAPPVPERNLYLQVVQADKKPSQAVLWGFQDFVVENQRKMARTPQLVACLLDKIMPPFIHTMRLGVQVESFFDTGGDKAIMWFATLEKIDEDDGGSSSGIDTIIEGQTYRYRNVEYEISSNAVAVVPYQKDPSGFRVQIFAEEWIPESVLEAAAARSKAEKKAEKDEEKKRRDHCAIGYLHAEFHDSSSMDIIRRIHKAKSAKKVVKLSFQDMATIAGLKGEIRKHFRRHHSDQDTIPWINPDPDYVGASTQVQNRLKESTTFPEDHQLQEFYGFGSSWLSNLNSFSNGLDEIEMNGTKELTSRLEMWSADGMLDKGVFSGLDGEGVGDSDSEAVLLEQGADSWRSTMKTILQTALKTGLIRP